MLRIRLRTLVNYALPIYLALFCIAATPRLALAQNDDKKATAVKQVEDIDLDTQLYLIVGTNQEVRDAKLPASLAAVVKQLRATLPFKNYSLSATLINRVKSDGRLGLKWIGGPMIESAAETRNTPSFNEFNVRNVKLMDDAEGRKIIRMDEFSFGARVPIIQTASEML